MLVLGGRWWIHFLSEDSIDCDYHCCVLCDFATKISFLWYSLNCFEALSHPLQLRSFDSPMLMKMVKWLGLVMILTLLIFMFSTFYGFIIAAIPGGKIMSLVVFSFFLFRPGILLLLGSDQELVIVMWISCCYLSSVLGLSQVCLIVSLCLPTQITLFYSDRSYRAFQRWYTILDEIFGEESVFIEDLLQAAHTFPFLLKSEFATKRQAIFRDNWQQAIFSDRGLLTHFYMIIW